MKANEYIDTYMTGITTDEQAKKGATEMFRAFAGEFQTICEQRKVKTVMGQEGVVRELNEKWNSIANKVEKMYHQPILKRNIIWNIFLSDADPVRWPKKPEGDE
jgi:hypothetical protein